MVEGGGLLFTSPGYAPLAELGQGGQATGLNVCYIWIYPIVPIHLDKASAESSDQLFFTQ